MRTDEVLLRESIITAGFSDSIVIHGFCSMDDNLLTIMEKSHILIAPTMSEFPEGFTSTIVEAVLAGRSVIASDLSAQVEEIL